MAAYRTRQSKAGRKLAYVDARYRNGEEQVAKLQTELEAAHQENAAFREEVRTLRTENASLKVALRTARQVEKLTVAQRREQRLASALWPTPTRRRK